MSGHPKTPKVIKLTKIGEGRFADTGEKNTARNTMSDGSDAPIGFDWENQRFVYPEASPDDEIARLIRGNLDDRTNRSYKSFMFGVAPGAVLGFVTPLVLEFLKIPPGYSFTSMAIGVGVGTAATFAAAALNKSHLERTWLGVGAGFMAVGFVVTAAYAHWTTPPTQVSEPYVNKDRFDWSKAPDEVLRDHWCVVDMEGHQKLGWDGKNLDCGPYPENPPDFPAPVVVEPATP